MENFHSDVTRKGFLWQLQLTLKKNHPLLAGSLISQTSLQPCREALLAMWKPPVNFLALHYMCGQSADGINIPVWDIWQYFTSFSSHCGWASWHTTCHTKVLACYVISHNPQTADVHNSDFFAFLIGRYLFNPVRYPTILSELPIWRQLLSYEIA